MSHSCLLCDPEEGDGTDPETCEEVWETAGNQWACAYPGRCLCPHYDHQAWECFTIEDAEVQGSGDYTGATA